MTRIGFGIDVGGSGVKGARVDLDTGEFIGERLKIATPKPATPDAVSETIAQILDEMEWDGAVGITLPAVIREQTALTAANIDEGWIGTNVSELFHRHLGDREICVLNDADAAGMAEANYGEPEARTGNVIFLTLGTGIGSAFLNDGVLVPNTEIGHMKVKGTEAEVYASSAAKDRDELSYTEWAKRLSKVLKEYEKLFWPSLFIVGGGISRKADKWIPKLKCQTKVIPAKLRNTAGIVGAAMAAEQGLRP